jgi:small conductance mechanosensitive channel
MRAAALSPRQRPIGRRALTLLVHWRVSPKNSIRKETNMQPKHVDYAALVWSWSATFAPRLLMSLIILIVGYLLAAWICRAVRRVLARTGRVDPTVQPVAAAAVRYSILALVLVAALCQLGIQTTSLLAVLGAAGLAIGLALQGTLTNIAAGIMLLWLRPFHVGDYIEVPSNNISGTVKEIGLFACHLENFDGIFVFAPNGSVWNAALRNYTRNSGRLISFTVTLPPSTPVDKAREILKTMIDEDNRVLKNPSPAVFVESYDSGKGLSTCTFRTTQGRAGEVQRDIIDEAMRRLNQAGISDTGQIVRKVPADNDPSRVIVV